jgi:hypothetical protein
MGLWGWKLGLGGRWLRFRCIEHWRIRSIQVGVLIMRCFTMEERYRRAAFFECSCTCAVLFRRISAFVHYGSLT